MSSALEEALLSASMFAIRRTQVAPFLRSLETPAATQQRALRAILRRNRDTDFARTHRLDSVSDTAEFRSALPIHEYEQLRPYIERQLETGSRALNPTAPTLYAQTSGTTGKAKYIPFCRDTMDAFRRAQSISTCIQHTHVPGIFRGKLLAMVSPLVEGEFSDGTPYGSMSGVVRHSLPQPIRRKSILPELVEFERMGYDDRYTLIAAIALCRRDLSCLASANPSTFVRLSGIINSQFAELVERVSRGEFSGSPSLVRRLRALCAPGAARLSELRALLSRGGAIRFSELWPLLAGVVTWTSGNCRALIPRLRSELDPAVKIIDMGYLASEFWGTIVVDVDQNLGVPTLGDNFFEFIEPEKWDRGERETKLLEEIELNTQYYIIATTPHGLYRYFINDIVEVTGISRQTPTIAFVQKGKGVTTLTGEKLYEGQVTEAVQIVCESNGCLVDSFIMLADRSRFHYTLYCESSIEFDVEQFAKGLGCALATINSEYAAKVESGRLPATSVKRLVPGTFDLYRRAAIAGGQREGQFKMVKLNYSDEIDFNFEEHLWRQK